MITLKEIKNLLEKAENPLIFYDDDGDGLTSYCLLERKYRKCKGMVVKGNFKDDLGAESPYIKKINNYKPDLVLILDKPFLQQEFIDKINVPVIWIDHHPVVKLKGIRYYNPRIRNKKDNRPVSYWCYKLVNQDLWLATVGVIGDWNLALLKKFKKKFPSLVNCKVVNPGDVIYKTKLGELIRVVNFLLKARARDVVRNSEVLCKIKSPYEILDKKSENGEFLFKQAEKIYKKYDKLLKEALKLIKNRRLIVFTYYSGDISLTGDLANELIYRFPEKVIIVAREKNDEMKMSLRSGENGPVLPEIIKKVLEEISGYGGGHDKAVGCNVSKKDFGKFLEIVKRNIY